MSEYLEKAKEKLLRGESGTADFAMVSEGGCRVHKGEACHYGLMLCSGNLMEEYWIGEFDIEGVTHVLNRCYGKEHHNADWNSWLFNGSPWAEAFLTKEDPGADGIVFMNPKSPTPILFAACIAFRQPYEYESITNQWNKLCNVGVQPAIAYLLSCALPYWNRGRSAEDTFHIGVQSAGSHHQPITLEGLNKDHYMAFVQGRVLMHRGVDQTPYNESEGHIKGAQALFYDEEREEGLKDFYIYDELKKAVANSTGEAKAVANPFAPPERLEGRKMREMGVLGLFRTEIVKLGLKLTEQLRVKEVNDNG